LALVFYDFVGAVFYCGAASINLPQGGTMTAEFKNRHRVDADLSDKTKMTNKALVECLYSFINGYSGSVTLKEEIQMIHEMTGELYRRFVINNEGE
jgi:hypothetical protein